MADFTSTTAATTVSFDLSGIRFTDYWQLRFFFQINGASDHILVTLNNDRDYSYRYRYGAGSAGTMKYLFYIPYQNTSSPVVFELVSQTPVAGIAPVFCSNAYNPSLSDVRDAHGVYNSGTWDTLTSI